MGRLSVFSGKDKKHRIQGYLTEFGSLKFELARKELGALYEEIMERPLLPEASDGDTSEYLARGPAETRKYLEAAKARR